MASVGGVASSLIVAYLAMAGIMFGCQRSLLYLPEKSRPDPDIYGLPGIETVTVATADALDLTHWYHPPAADTAPVVVVFHGNAGHIGYRVQRFRFLMDAGIGVFLAEYRGYGGNPGKPSEEGLTADGCSVMAYLSARGIAPERLLIYGESLGTALAIKMAAEYPIAGLVLEAPFTSIADVAQSHYWYMPAKWMLFDKWDAAARIGEVSAPLLVLHGERDKIIPTSFGRRLYEAANQPKEALFLPAAGHNDLFDYPEAPRRILEFVNRLTAGGLRKDAAD